MVWSYRTNEGRKTTIVKVAMATRRKKEREMCIEAENIYEVYL
jgi:hypothetical protein